MGLKIREARLSDVGVLDSFQHEIGVHERKLDNNIKRKGRIRYYTLKNIKRLIKSNKAVVLVAEAEGKPIGCGLGEIRKNQADWSRYRYKGYIGMMFVGKKYRGKGIGKKILVKILEWLRRNKLKDIRLTVYQNNVGAVRLYRKCGFKDSLLEMGYKG